MSDLVQDQLNYISDQIADVRSQLVPLQRMEINPARRPLTRETTLYVRAGGSDANDGLANTDARAFGTPQAAIDAACTRYDPGLYSIIIQLQSVTWSLSSILYMRRHSGAYPIVLRGDVTTPANVVLESDQSYVVHCLSEWAPWKLEGLTIRRQSGTTNNFLLVSERGNITLGRMAFGASGTGAQILISSSSFLTLEGSTIDVLGGSQALLRSADHSVLRIANATFVFPVGGVAFVAAFVMAQSHGSVYAGGNTFTNGAAVTGARYVADMLAHIRTNGGGANYFPGNAAGSVTNGAIYT